MGHLIVTRKLTESVIVGRKGDVLSEPLMFTILGVKGDQVRVGIRAPENVSVDREEIRERKDREGLRR